MAVPVPDGRRGDQRFGHLPDHSSAGYPLVVKMLDDRVRLTQKDRASSSIKVPSR
jgi:hypothetical protein